MTRITKLERDQIKRANEDKERREKTREIINQLLEITGSIIKITNLLDHK
jgi:hypothetical protein